LILGLGIKKDQADEIHIQRRGLIKKAAIWPLFLWVLKETGF